MSVELFDRDRDNHSSLAMAQKCGNPQPLDLNTVNSSGPVIADGEATGAPNRQPPFDMPSFADALNRIGFFCLGSDEIGVR